MKTNISILTKALIASGTILLSASIVQAQSTSWAVFENCNVSPCVMGVATLDYATPGNGNYAAAWRQKSQSYGSNADASRTMCRWDWRSTVRTSPDIDNGALNCVALCGGNGSCQ